MKPARETHVTSGNGRQARPAPALMVPGRLIPMMAALLYVGLMLAALTSTAMFAFASIQRSAYPYDLDFIEDSMLIQSLRFAQGEPVYVAPNAEFVPHVYMPLYSWLGGMLFRLFGVGYAPLRLLSTMAALLTAALLFVVAAAECRDRPHAFNPLPLFGAALYLAGYRLTGFWYDLARVDALFVALSLAGMAAGFYAGPGRFLKLGQVLSALLLALAFFTKQTALAFGACVGVYLWAAHGRQGWIFVSVWLGAIGLGLAALNASTGGWFLYHTFLVAGADRVEIGRVFHYLGVELSGWMAGLSVMAAASAVLAWRREGARALRGSPWLLAIGAAAVVSGAGRASVGGNLNNLMPVYALLCLAPALLWKALSAPPIRTVSPRVWQGLIAAGLLVQFALGAYNPLRTLPTRDMRERGDRLIARIAAVDGPVLVMMHPYYAWRAGKAPSAQVAELWYLLEWSGVPLPEDFVDRIRRQHYAAIVSSESLFETDPRLRSLIESSYTRAGEVDGPPTLAGMVVRPSAWYVRR